MILIGENINVGSATVSAALKDKNAAVIQQIAKTEVAAGIDVLDINIGPTRKGGEELMTWAVQTVQAVTDKMLSLDTANMAAMEAGLKASKNKVLINSVSLQSSRIDQGLALAQKYNADPIGLLWSNEGMPRDANERALYTVDFVYKANAAGITNNRIWIDPIVSPVSVEINQVKACVEFMAMLEAIAPGCKSVAGISNLSNGTPSELRCWLNRTYMIMLMRHGLYAGIVDANDKELIAIARGQRPEVVKLVHRIMDGGAQNLATLPKEMQNYARTTRVLMGQTLYSHSWLEV
jgi:5-methyltetrahydrofolate corrinoid/iron sulfur protein methyltransferase